MNRESWFYIAMLLMAVAVILAYHSMGFYDDKAYYDLYRHDFGTVGGMTPSKQ